MDKELIATVTINKYIRKVQVSKEAQPKFYKQTDNLPPKYKNRLGLDYQWIQFLDGIFLADCDKKPVIKNHKDVGKPKYLLIDGQRLHQLTLKDYERSKIIKAIKEQMIPEVAKLEPISIYPLRIIMELHDTVIDAEYGKDAGWDIDNRSIFYCKTFPDVLQGCLSKDKDTGKLIPTSKVIIPNDSRLYITQPPVPLFIPIEDTENRKLVFKIYHDKRIEILNSKYYGRRV